MKKIYLISTNFLKENSTVNLNVEDSLLRNSILEAQNIQLKSTLGTTLFSHILTLVEEGDIGEVGYEKYKTLLDEYIVPQVLYWTIFHCLPFLNFKFNNKNVGKQNSENTDPASLEEVRYLSNLTKDKAEFYSEQTTKFLRKNYSVYPEYTSTDNCGLTHPAKSNYSTGMALD